MRSRGEYLAPRVWGQRVELGLCVYEGPARKATRDIYGATVWCLNWADRDQRIFYNNWKEQYGSEWPHTRDGPHGALRDLIAAHRAFGEAHCVEWIRECRIQCWRTSEKCWSLERLCGTTTERIDELLHPPPVVKVRTARRPVENRAENQRGTKRKLGE